ncbi:DUF1028 domain-containing protein [Devosia ginsengisoli]|uniref:DUF1028 domain-containing protein n=1 Tax=Devosia ginsengisoli TaxID=400770 RepID=UPI0026F35978|nr:DUF1028 domain-containing protein [Devosia ginsengisoli]MCR6672425.1 DUF1028 domain-containing protein [Devosia ginsengisoli]
MTFSIVARDPITGAFGVATATAGPMVGALVPHTRRGFGAAATQAMTNPYLAIDTLALLDGQPAEAALRAALARDAEAERRQIIVVDRAGRVDGWTGSECVPYAGHLTGDGVAVAGNMLTGPDVLKDMLASYRQSLESSGFASSLLQALIAGAAAGGDSRGIGSAALRVHGDQAFADIDLRVDFSEDPMAAIESLFEQAVSGSYADFFATVPRRRG